MNSTPPHLIAVVVYTFAILSALYVSTLAWCVMQSIAVDPVTQSAFSAVGAGIVGTFTGLLINTRSARPDVSEKTTIVTETPAKQTPEKTEP